MNPEKELAKILNRQGIEQKQKQGLFDRYIRSESPPSNPKFYKQKPKRFGRRKVWRNFDLINKFVVLKSLQVNINQSAVEKPKPSLLSWEEKCILEDINEDYKAQRYQTLILAAVMKCGLTAMFVKLTFFSMASMPQRAACLFFLAFAINFNKIQQFLFCPKLNYYLELMQVGEEHQLGREAKEFVDFLDGAATTEQISQELKMIRDFSLHTLLYGNIDQLEESELRYQDVVTLKDALQVSPAQRQDVLTRDSLLKKLEKKPVEKNQTNMVKVYDEKEYLELYRFLAKHEYDK